MTTDEIREEAQRRLEAERAEFERRAAEELAQVERDAASVRDEAQRRLVIEHITVTFGRVLAVLRDQQAVTALMSAAGLIRTTTETRVNPTGTTTQVTTTHVPKLLGMACNRTSIGILFELEVGQTVAHWRDVAEILRAGLRAERLEVIEPRSGQIQLNIATAKG